MGNEQYAIEMLNITKRFPGIIANDNITLQLRHGEIHALLGENGAGKSTLMSVLFGLYQAEEGIIKKDGVEVKINDPNDANALGIGMVHQHFKLVHNFTVLENICLPHRLCGEYSDLEKQAMQLLEEFGMEAMAQDYPTNLSGGERRRVAVARAVVHQPKLVIADEPTSDLDEENTALIMEHFQRQADSGKAVLISTHDLSCLRPNMVRYKMNKGVMQRV